MFKTRELVKKSTFEKKSDVNEMGHGFRFLTRDNNCCNKKKKEQISIIVQYCLSYPCDDIKFTANE